MRHEVHGELLMIVAVVVASRKTNQYRCRVCFTLAEDGRMLTWFPPPFSQCACVIHRYVCAHQLALVCMLSFIAVLVARLRSGANAPVAEGDDVDVDVDVDQKEDVDAAAAAAAAATAVGVGGGGDAAAGGGGAGATPTGAVTLADVALLLPDPVMPLSQLPILLRYLFSPVVSRKFATLKKKMEIVTHADCSSSGGGGGGSSSNSSSGGGGGGGNGSNSISNSSNSHINSSGGGGGGSGGNSSSSGGGSGSTSSNSNISSGRGGGGGSSNSNSNSSNNNNNNTGAAAATAADDDDGGGGGGGDDDDGDYSEEEDVAVFITGLSHSTQMRRSAQPWKRITPTSVVATAVGTVRRRACCTSG